jgi:hypothetical protein
MQLLSEGRFTLGLGAGENLNEHIVGGRWPLASVRQQMLAEAVEIIRALWAGGTVTYRGRHFDVESARVWDLPETAPPIGIAVSGPEGCRLAGQHADAMIATEPRSELGQLFDDAGGSGKPRIGQIALSYDPDEQAAVRRAMEQFRWFTGGWRVNAELPVPASFEMASGQCGRRTWPHRCRAGPTSGGTSPGSANSGRQGSPTSHWCRSAPTPNRNSSAGRRPSCCQPSERPDRAHEPQLFRGRGRGAGCSAAVGGGAVGDGRAVVRGNDPSVAYGEHTGGVVVAWPAVVGVDPWDIPADHDQVVVGFHRLSTNVSSGRPHPRRSPPDQRHNGRTSRPQTNFRRPVEPFGDRGPPLKRLNSWLS